jgi:16S rRNA (guanine527-N7)-methyltransferase
VDTQTIAALIRPFVALTPELLQQTSAYLQLLLKWNARINLTAVRDPREIVTRHFGESFFAAEQLLHVHAADTVHTVHSVHSVHPPSKTLSVIDLGSGAGFPGLPLAMYAPQAQVALIESNARKVAFLNQVISALGLRNARAVRQRAEEYPAKAELVTMRAVETFEKASLVAQDLVAEGGRLALMIGAAQVPQAEAQLKQMIWSRAVPVPGSNSRVLFVGTRPGNQVSKGGTKIGVDRLLRLDRD